MRSSSKFKVTIVDRIKVLPIPFPIRKYNKHMRGSDANAQCRSYYSADTRSVWLVLVTSISALALMFLCSTPSMFWKTFYPNLTLSHVDFQHTIALSFTQNPLAIGRKYASKLNIEGSNPMIPPPTHHFIQI